MGTQHPVTSVGPSLLGGTAVLGTKVSITGVQLDHLNNLLHSTLGALAAYRKGVEKGSDYGGRKDGGVISGFESTILNTLTRLDHIVDDSARWTRDESILEMSSREVNNSLRRGEAETTLLEDAARPSLRYPLQIAKVATGWAAVFQAVNGQIIGMGSTPEAALRDFDRAFSRVAVIPEKVEKSEPAPVAPEKPTPRKLKKGSK